MRVEGAEIRRVREQLGEHQAQFGARFGRTRRQVIRWEQGGAYFASWRQYRRVGKEYQLEAVTQADVWAAALKDAERRAKVGNTKKAKRAAAIAPGTAQPAARRGSVRVAKCSSRARRASSSGKGKRRAARSATTKRRGVTRRQVRRR